MSINQNRFRVAVAALTLTATLAVTTAPATADNDPYLGDILITGANFCPRGWLPADGQLLAISQYTAVFALIGTTYGGDGRTSFGLPDLRGRTAMDEGTGPGLATRRQGQKFGSTSVTLTTANLPAHTHTVRANNLDGDKPGPKDKLLAAAPPGGMGNETIYSLEPATVQMSSNMISDTGGNGSISVTDPSLVMTYCIAVVGIFPSRS